MNTATAQIRITRTYPVTPDKVWRAWTDPQALSQWFGPGTLPSHATAVIDLRVGGEYLISFAAPDGETHTVSGVYQEVEPARRLVFTFAWKGTPDRVSRVTLELAPAGGGTELRFVHDRFFNQKARDDHARGWPVFFDNLHAFFKESAP
ncbi:SRPBCC family protein [Variovorax guangxiensis]|uniref:SRPBCC domain-containing protein n=1 Tax=Variovorax guangxiensis TaxID=1775474 RepID=A0A502DWU7_9BURK|nr:SRPBCC domain-containing protein [Variovorax ginsengisoli]TPG28862.1 SRPBCC domain-containing protein [Variovorax guangxiensis]